MLLVSQSQSLGLKRNALTEGDEINWVFGKKKGTREREAYEGQTGLRLNVARWIEEKRTSWTSRCWQTKTNRTKSMREGSNKA